MVFSRQMRFFALASALAASACTQTFDVGHNRPHGLLPVDQRNPIILLNDGAYDNWSGEYAVLLANGGGSPLAAIIVNETSAWPDIQTNVGGYRDLVVATVTDRVVVVSSLGSTTSTGGGMGSPNGQGDPWADVIVTSRFRYVQVSAWYDQLTDVPTSR